jgi:hypothetical protein
VKREVRYIAAFIFVLAILFCGVAVADEAVAEKVYVLCKSETGKLKVINTTPDKVVHELEELKNSSDENYTVVIGGDKVVDGCYMISVGDDPAGSVTDGAVSERGGDESLLGGNNPERWFERLPALICTEVATVVLLVTLGWYYKRRKLPLRR